MEIQMQTQPYNPVQARNIALEMAQVQRERGVSLTKNDFLQIGYTEDQIDRNGIEAARLFAQMETRAA
jgi:hypothetical protein